MPRRIQKRIGLIADWMGRILNTTWMRSVAVMLLALIIAMLTTLSVERVPKELEVGAIATRDIKADRGYEIVDEEATQRFRDEAAAAVQSVYDFDEALAEQVAQRVLDAFTSMRERLTELGAQPGRRKARLKRISADQEQKLRAEFRDELGVTIAADDWRAFLNDGFSDRSAIAVAFLIRKLMLQPIIAERAALADEKDVGITIRRVQRRNGKVAEEKEWRIENVAKIPATEEVRQQLYDVKMRRDSFKDPRMPRAIRALASAMIGPSLSFDRAETERRRAQAAAAVKSSILKIKAGEMIIRNGSRYDRWHIKVLRGIEKEKQRGAFSKEFFGTLLLALIILVVPFTLARHFVKRFHPSPQDYFLMGAVGLVVLVLMRIMMAVLPEVREAFFTQVPATALNYVIPVAGGAMLIRMVLNAEVTIVFAIVMSLLTSLFVQTDLQFTTFVLLSSFAGMIAIAHVDRRTLIMRAGLITGAVNMLAVVGIRLMGMVSVTEAMPAVGLMWSALFGFLGGIGAAVFVMIATPIVESLMNYTTDIKLLELANLNHPLLRELIVSAPGTYHHSHVVGILGEAAAEAIAANALVVRVGAYYHDIGKMKKPPYFIENARNGDNRHEKLTPHMSALIVQAHVKDGIEMAQASRLPKVIIDMIPQHHGTRMISFFYEKAKAQEDPDRQKIDPKDFRYPGPKPQTREAAILMLADVAEAQVRSLKEKNPARIEQTVRKIIDDVFREAQLDECDLTLKDLDDIHKAFVRILLGMYHQRIEYPDKDKGEKVRENMGGGTAESAQVS